MLLCVLSPNLLIEELLCFAAPFSYTLPGSNHLCSWSYLIEKKQETRLRVVRKSPLLHCLSLQDSEWKQQVLLHSHQKCWNREEHVLALEIILHLHSRKCFLPQWLIVRSEAVSSDWRQWKERCMFCTGNFGIRLFLEDVPCCPVWTWESRLSVSVCVLSNKWVLISFHFISVSCDSNLVPGQMQ